MARDYNVSCEVSGYYAMWTRPDTGDCPVSYPAPTFSAAKGIFESILWGPAIDITPTCVEICRPVKYQNYITNYGGPLRKAEAVSMDNNYQLMATVLVDVCYKFYAKVAPVRMGREFLPDSAIKWDKMTTSPGHAYKAIFERRLKRGQCFSIPFLGWKEFVPQYVGPLRDSTKAYKDLSITIPSMLNKVFPNGFESDVNFVFTQDIHIKNGVLIYPERKEGNNA